MLYVTAKMNHCTVAQSGMEVLYVAKAYTL